MEKLTRLPNQIKIELQEYDHWCGRDKFKGSQRFLKVSSDLLLELREKGLSLELRSLFLELLLVSFRQRNKVITIHKSTIESWVKFGDIPELPQSIGEVSPELPQSLPKVTVLLNALISKGFIQLSDGILTQNKIKKEKEVMEKEKAPALGGSLGEPLAGQEEIQGPPTREKFAASNQFSFDQFIPGRGHPIKDKPRNGVKKPIRKVMDCGFVAGQSVEEIKKAREAAEGSPNHPPT